ncbi:MAG: imelysin family protein [Thalassobaculales bacterium]
MRAIIALALLLLAAPAPAADHAALNRAVVAGHILPAYARLTAATAALEQATAAGCGDADRLRAAFATATLAWQGAQHLRFGPADWFNRARRFALWPDPRNTVGRQLAELLARGSLPDFATGSVAVQGLTALERMLFEPALAARLAEPFPCAWLRATAANLAGMARDLEAEWRGDRYLPMVQPQEATLEIFKSLHTAVELAADHKIARPLGNSPAAARPRLAEHWRSALSGPAVAENLRAAESLFAAMAPFVADRALAADIAGRLAATAAAARDLDLDHAWSDPQLRPAAERLRADLAALKTVLAEKLTAALDIPLGFNALDGD